MSGWKGGGVLLVLAIPLVLYAAWQVQGVVRTDMVVSDVPPDRGAPKEQLVATKNKMSGWAGDVRKASGVAQGYTNKAAAGELPADPVAAEVANAAAVRAADLNDLSLFLNDVKAPNFAGKLKVNYVEWKKDADLTHETRRAVADWLAKPASAATAGDANTWMGELERRINEYLKTGFANREHAAVWRVEGRLKVIEQLARQADDGYPKAVEVSLPLKPGDDLLKSTLATFKAVKKQVEDLGGDIQQAENEKADLTPFKAKIDERKSAAAKASGREKLLALFARDKLFTDATGAAAWLQEVGVLYREATPGDKLHIRKKVQEFCEAFIPAVARLDDTVLIDGKSAERSTVEIKYRENGEAKYAPLSADPNGLTEFNAATRYPGESTMAFHANSAQYLTKLMPTKTSKAALVYNDQRKSVPPGKGGLKWTIKTVEDLKNKCEPERVLVNQLKSLGEKDEAKIFVRLEGLLEGLKANPELVEGAQ